MEFHFETFFVSWRDFAEASVDTWQGERMAETTESCNWLSEAESLQGWYWWTCQPGCLPDSEADGPYGSAQDAVRVATDGLVQSRDESGRFTGVYEFSE